MNIMKETMEHFNIKDEPNQEKDRFAGFGTYYVNGRQVIDLTSIDEEYIPVAFNFNDIERQSIYGDKAGDTNLM